MTGDPQRLYGCIIGAYTCKLCNSPSAAAVDYDGDYAPVCVKHGKAAEREGLRVLWSAKVIDPAAGTGRTPVA